MQTLHLRFRDLRVILLGETPSRWPTPSVAMRDETKGPPGLSNSPRPTSAVGAHPETSHQRLDRCPTLGAGLPLTSSFREPRVGGAVGAIGHTIPDTRLVCWSQTARHLPPYPAPHEAGDLGADDGQAHASITLRAVSRGLSSSIRPAPRKAGAGWKKTADPKANVGTLARVSKGAVRRRLRLWRGVR